MAQDFIGCGRERAFLLPRWLCGWVPEDYLAWLVIDAVAGLDLGGFYAATAMMATVALPMSPR